jgi:hypothetical protein
MQSDEKLLTKRTNPSSSHNSGPQKKKTSNITRSTQFILPKPQQKGFKPPLQLQHIPQLPQFQQQRNILRSHDFPQKPSQEQHVSQQYEIDPQLYGTPPNPFEINESYNENTMLVSL